MQEQQIQIEGQTATIKEQQEQLQDALNKIEKLTRDIEALKGIRGEVEPGKAVIDLKTAKLLNAIPNPASNNSTIYYSLPESSPTGTIQLKDWNGKTLQSIAVAGAGNSSIIMQTDMLASGTYYYSLIVDNKLVESKKLTIAAK